MIDDILASLDKTAKPQFMIRRPTRRKWIALLSLVACLGVCVTVFFIELTPVDRSSLTYVRVMIPDGAAASDIGQILVDHHLIRHVSTFELYTLVTGTKDKLRAGGHALKKSQSLSEIVADLTGDKTDDFRVIILPGLTLEQLADPTIRGSLADQGFTKDEIMAAYAASYDLPLFKDKPLGTSLEGYIHPDTYGATTTGSLEDVLQASFREMQRVLVEKDAVAKLHAQGLTLYQGITLASIVQKEVSDPVTQRQVAQVFLKRLRDNMTLGSDVTFIYIATKEGRTPSVNDPSPYNTRRTKGLPPGPIANFNTSALDAVLDPAAGDYVYFVAGDDGVTYFARTEAEHNANIAAHCKVLCSQH